MSWLDKFFNTGYATLLVAGVAVPQERALNFASGATAVDNPLRGRTDVTISSSAGSTYITTTRTGYTLTAIPWQTQPVDTSVAPVTIVASLAAIEGQCVELPDASGTYGTNALTFNGNGHNVEDPYNPSAAVNATWTSPAGFNRLAPAWMLIKNGSGTLFWKSLRSC
jgi:hypothetical protein